MVRSHSLELAPVVGREGKGYSNRMVRMDRTLQVPVLLEVAAHGYQDFCRLGGSAAQGASSCSGALCTLCSAHEEEGADSCKRSSRFQDSEDTWSPYPRHLPLFWTSYTAAANRKCVCNRHIGRDLSAAHTALFHKDDTFSPNWHLLLHQPALRSDRMKNRRHLDFAVDSMYQLITS